MRSRERAPQLNARFAADLAALAPELPLGLAVSGGPDSLALLLLAHAALSGQVRAATVDHRLRASAAAEAAMVGEVCAELGVPHTILAATVVPDGQGLQAAARAARYAALGGWCAGAGCAALATAHHADDQAETLLMRLARGSGVAGLSGVRALASFPQGDGARVRVLRPLLTWRRAELHAVVRDAGLVPADDPANRDPRHDRTAARALLAVTPWLDPARLAAAAAHLGEADQALAWAADRAWAERVDVGETITLHPAGLPPEIVRRLLARALAKFDATPDGPALARFAETLAAGGTGTVGGVKGQGGSSWILTAAPPRRGN